MPALLCVTSFMVRYGCEFDVQIYPDGVLIGRLVSRSATVRAYQMFWGSESRHPSGARRHAESAICKWFGPITMCALVTLRHPRGTLTDPVMAHHEAAVDDVTCRLLVCRSAAISSARFSNATFTARFPAANCGKLRRRSVSSRALSERIVPVRNPWPSGA